MAGLLCYADEGGSTAQLLEFGCAHIGAGGAEPPKHVPDCVFYISSVGNLHCPTLRRPKSKIQTQEKSTHSYFSMK